MNDKDFEFVASKSFNAIVFIGFSLFVIIITALALLVFLSIVSHLN